MTPEEIVAAEREGRRWAVPAAFTAGALPLLAGVISLVIVRGAPQNLPSRYVFLAAKAAGLNVAAVVRAIGVAALGVLFVYLYRAAKARRPAMPGVFLWMGIIGAAGSALCGTFSQTPSGIITQAVSGLSAGNFLTDGGQTYQHIIDQSSGGIYAVLAVIELLCTFVLAGALIVVSLNAMRVGLLPRAFGYIGVAAGVFAVFPLGQPIPVVLCFWLIAIGLLVMGRFPGGTPPAWEAGEAIPWPSARAAREEEQETSDGREAPAPPTPVPPHQPAHPGAARRKRKKRA